jgi:PilZ domain-containing protein
MPSVLCPSGSRSALGLTSGEPLRRAFRRFARLDCQVVREHDFRLVADLALDLSTHGMLVRARERVLSGEELIVSFKLPRIDEWFDAQALVARVLHGRRPGDYGVCLGLEFYGVSLEDQERLFAQLRGLRAPDALRPRRSLASRAA